jgi:hypothetical protein
MVLECDNYLYDSIFNLSNMLLTLFVDAWWGFKVSLLKNGIKQRQKLKASTAGPSLEVKHISGCHPFKKSSRSCSFAPVGIKNPCS